MRTVVVVSLISGFVLTVAPAPGAPDGQVGPQRRKGGSTVRLTPEAEATMHRFRDALQKSEWGRALRQCSSRVTAKAEDYSTPEAFFKDVLPVDAITGTAESLVHASRTTVGQADRPASFKSFGCFAHVPEPRGELTLCWTWTVDKTGDGWSIDFEPVPLDKWIREETERIRRQTEAVKARQRALEPKLEGVHTRLAAVRVKMTQGEPVLLSLELINGGPAELWYDDQQVRVNQSMSVTDQHGQTVPCTAGPIQTGGSPRLIRPGESAVLFDDLDIASQYDLSNPGIYDVRFNGRGLMIGDWGTEADSAPLSLPVIVNTPRQFPSNTVRIEIFAG